MPSSNPDFGQVLRQWRVPEYFQYERSRRWYFITAAILLLLVAYAVFTGNFLFALVILLFAAIIFLSHSRPPLLLDFRITEKGLAVNDKFYPYDEIKSFWIIYEAPAIKNVYFDFNAGTRPALSVFLDEQKPEEIRETLSRFLTEDSGKKDEPFSELIWRLLKL